VCRAHAEKFARIHGLDVPVEEVHGGDVAQHAGEAAFRDFTTGQTESLS
jgi:hypothetical protein